MGLLTQNYENHYFYKFLLYFSLTIFVVQCEKDVIFHLGGLFAVHEKGNGNEHCGRIMPEKGIQRMEAMLYAIDQINNNEKEWNFSFEATVYDTCSSDTVALQESLKFLKIDCNNTNRKITGVIGANNSPVSESVATIFRLFKVPQVSYASTSANLDDTHMFPFFFRVVPSDSFQVKAMAELIRRMKWNYISTVSKKGEYGNSALKLLEDEFSATDEVCFPLEVTIPRQDKEENYDKAIEDLLSYNRSRVVVVFLNQESLRKLLKANKKKTRTNQFIWIGSDSWGTKTEPVSSLESTAEGAITIMPKRNLIKGFDEYFKKLRPGYNRRNRWFDEYWEEKFNCTLDSKPPYVRNNCTGFEIDEFKQEGLVAMVVDSVYVMAHALRKMCREKQTVCKNWDRNPDKELLKSYIWNVSFISAQGEGMRITFDEKRHIPINYTIHQYKRMGDKYDYEKIGEWNPSTGLKLETIPKWSQGYKPPCSENCKPGYQRVYQNQHRCCWTCSPCEDNSYLPDARSTCITCESGYKSNDNKTGCVRLIPEYLGDDWSSPWLLIPIIFSIVGVITTLITFVIFLFYYQTPIIRASGRELCHVIFFGILLCYLFTFLAVTKPSANACGFVRADLGLGLSVCYAAILTKTNRISRIFNRNLRSTKRPMYISPKSQLVICFCLVLIQITFSVMWLIVSPPKAVEEIMKSPYAVILTCGIDTTSVMLSLLYNMGLIILCTVYAFKTRNIPENFNEAKYISFSMYASCIIWFAFIPIYCSSWKDYKVQATILCMNVGVSGTIVLFCLFFPKIYIVLFKPEKNVRYPTTTNSSGAAMGQIRLNRSTLATEFISQTRISADSFQTKAHTLPSDTREISTPSEHA